MGGSSHTVKETSCDISFKKTCWSSVRISDRGTKTLVIKATKEIVQQHAPSNHTESVLMR